VLSSGATNQIELSRWGLANTPIIVPPLDEQKSIARFLDRETTRIDTLITKKCQLIDLLQKKRDAIIYQAVIKGIDDQLLISQGVGFDWCWDVPKEWEVVRLKFVAGVQTGLTLGKNYKDRTLVSRPYLRVANVQDGFLDLSEITKIEIPPEDASRYELKTRDVLMTEGGDFDKLGRGCVWEGQIDGCLHQNHVFAVRPHIKYLDSHYLSVIMTSYYGKAYFTSTSQQTTNLATTNSTKLGNFPLPLPSINQQSEILRELDSKLSKLFSAIDKLKEQIGYMYKHRLSLITAAISGKIDVRKVN
jgi:type I restriction enzyme S subunit